MLTIAEVLEKADEQPQWICNPYIARRGITFLHGKTSIGKSPFSWEAVRTTSQGLPFLGLPTVKSRVLYLEADGAEILLRSRLRLLPEPIGDWRIAFLAGTSLNLCDPDHKMFNLFKLWQREWDPDFVVWNTLRQFYKGNAIDSDTVTRVYNAMQREFPHAGHLVIGHDRKTPPDPDSQGVDDEDFSGSGAWRDLATIGLHLVRKGTKKDSYLHLLHTKTQVSEQVEPLRLILEANGTTITSALPTRERILELWDEALSAKVKDCGTWVGDRLNISRRTVFRIKGQVSE